MELESTGSLARKFDVRATTFLSWAKNGMPGGSTRVAGRRVYTLEDVAAVIRWMDAHGKKYKKPVPAGSGV